MKKLILGFLVMCIPPYLGGSEWIDNTFFSPKSYGLNVPMEMKAWNMILDENREDENGIILSLSPFFSISQNGHDIGRYFFPNGSNTISVATSIANPFADVDPRNFNLPTDYQGALTISPHYYAIGSRLDMFQDLGKWFTGLYWSAGIPIVYCSSYASPFESITAQGTRTTGAPTSILTALDGSHHTSDWNSSFTYGKIDANHHTKIGLADVDLKLGLRFFNKPAYKLGGNVNLIIPAGTHTKSNYLLEPMIGNAGHIGVGIGLDASYLLNQCGNPHRFIRASSHQRLTYMTESIEQRTLGLKDKRWGQYMRMRQQNPSDRTQVLAGAIPGTTALTRNVDVAPGYQYESTWTLEGKANHFNFSLGYNGWYRSEEDLKLSESFTHNEVYGLASINGTLAAETAAVGVSSDSTIALPATGNGQFLTESDIELKPHPTSSAHTLFLTLGMDNNNISYPLSGLVGVSYTLPIKRTALEQWSIWASLITSF